MSHRNSNQVSAGSWDGNSRIFVFDATYIHTKTLILANARSIFVLGKAFKLFKCLNSHWVKFAFT